MASTTPPRLISISSDNLSGGLDECCEMLSGPVGRIIRLIEANGPSPFYHSKAWLVPGLTVNMVHASQMGMSGSQSLVGRDDLYINIPLEEFSYRVTQAGREAIAARGSAATSLSSEAYTVTSGQFSTSARCGRALTLVIDRSLLRDLVINEDTMVAGHIAQHKAALHLLISYVSSLCRIEDAMPAPMAGKIVRHSAELIALALGPTAHAKDIAREGSLSAARLAQAKRYIKHHLADPNLSEQVISASLGISISLLRKDFERSGLSLGRYIRAERANKAAALLSGQQTLDMKIIDIAFLSGFGDISTFNRVFFRQFGCSPRDFRMGFLDRTAPT